MMARVFFAALMARCTMRVDLRLRQQRAGAWTGEIFVVGAAAVTGPPECGTYAPALDPADVPSGRSSPIGSAVAVERSF